MDAEIKEIGFIVTFALLIGFGYFSISLDDLAFTQPAPPYRYLSIEPQEAYAEVPNILSKYNYDPILTSALLVMPTAIDFPPPDPAKYFAQRYSNGIQLEFGFIEIQEFLMPNINKFDFLPPITNKIFSDFQVLPPAYAVNLPAPSLPTPDFFDDFTTDKGWISNNTLRISLNTASGTINVTDITTATSADSKISLNINDLLTGGWDESKWTLRGKMQINFTDAQDTTFTLLGVHELDQSEMSGTLLKAECTDNDGVAAPDRDQGCFTWNGNQFKDFKMIGKNDTDGSAGYSPFNVNTTNVSIPLDTFVFPEIIVDENFIRATLYSDADYQHVLGCTNNKFDSSSGDCDFDTTNRGVTRLGNIDTESVKWSNLNYLWFGQARSTGFSTGGSQGSIHEVSFWNGINITEAEVTSAITDPVTGFTLTLDNVNDEIDLSWNSVTNATEYVVQRLSTERQEEKNSSLSGDNNFATSMNGGRGDHAGIVEGDIVSMVALKTGVFSGAGYTDGIHYSGLWTDVVIGASGHLLETSRGELEQTGFQISSGTRLSRDCNSGLGVLDPVGTNVFVFNLTGVGGTDGYTHWFDGSFTDGACKAYARMLGNQLHNLTGAEAGNIEIAAVQAFNSTGGSFLAIKEGVGTGHRLTASTGTWITTDEIETGVWILNKTWVNQTTTSSTSFTDITTNDFNSFFYRIIPTNVISEGNPSNVLNGTLSKPPLRVADLNGTDNGSGTVDLVWTKAEILFNRVDSNDPVQGYIIQRNIVANETTIYDGLAFDVNERFMRNNGSMQVESGGTDQSTGTSPSHGSDVSHGGQLLNITSAMNITRMVIKLGVGQAVDFNTEPDMAGAIFKFDPNAELIARTIWPRVGMTGDMNTWHTGDDNNHNFVNFAFSPPVEIQAGEYGFVWSSLNSQTCNSASCGLGFADTGDFKFFFDTTNNGDADGYAIGDIQVGGLDGFVISPLGGVGNKTNDYAMAVYAENQNWITIGTNLGENNLTFSDTTAPIPPLVKSYRILAFNDAGISEVPTLLHNPQGTLLGKQGNSTHFFAKDEFGRYSAGGADDDSPTGGLNIGEMITFGAAVVNPPEPITDLQVRIENTTSIYSPGAAATTQIFDKFPTIITQVTPTFTNPTLIDSIQIDIKETGVTALPIGTVKAVIIGDKTGDLTDGSLLSNIYFIENSTNTISTALLPALAIFNFTGNTILNSGDFDVGVGIVIDSHDSEIIMDLFGSGAFGKMIGTGADCAGDNLVFDDEACSGVATSDLSGLNIFGGNARAILSWTEPIGSPTGYNILRANATQLILYDEEIELSSLCATIPSDGRCEDIGTVADPLGFVGQRITFPTDVQLTDIMLNLGYNDGFPFSDGDIDIQGVILKDAPVGTGSFTRVANSTFVKLGDTLVGDVTGGNAFLFNNFNNCCPEGFTFNNTILTAGVEYIIGVESFGTFSGTDKFLISHNATANVNAPNNGLGVFTKLHVGTSDLWVNNSTENLNAMFMGLNYTIEVADTGNTDIEYTSIADFPSADKKINAYEYLVKAINSGGSANASNTAEISPDRSGFDLWDYREHDSRTFFDAECQFGNNDQGVFTMNNTSTAGVGSCDLFKSFNKTEMTGSDIKITINFTDSGRLFFSVIDGSYDKDDFAEFPMNIGFPVPVIGDPIKGIGRLNFTDSFFIVDDQCDFPQQVGLRQCEIVIPASDIDYAGSTENEITVMLQVRQETAIGKIEISNVGSWDFTNNPRKVIGIDNGDSILISNGASINQDDRGNLYSNGVFAGNVSVVVPNPPTSFTAIPVAPYKIDLDWVHDLIDVTGYNIYRGNATVPFTLIVATNNGTITEFEDANQLNLTAAIVNSLKNARGLAANTNFNYTICAFNGAGEEQTCATTSATTSDDTDVWNLKEHDSEVNILAIGGADSDFTATGGSGDWLSIKMSTLSRAGNSAILWKSFNVSEITGSDIQFFWDGDVSGILTPDNTRFRICEDKITPYNETIWAENLYPVCTVIAGQTTVMPTGSGTTFDPVFSRWSIDWSEVTTDFITVLFSFDDDLLATAYDLDFRNMTWTNKTSYDFTGLTINYTNTNDPPLDGADFECNSERPNYSSSDMCDAGVFLATSTPHLELKAVVGVNDWQYREFADTSSTDGIPFFTASIDSSGFKMISDEDVGGNTFGLGEMVFFKSFPASSVINKNITIGWDGVIDITSGMSASVQVYNGTIDRWNGNDFTIQSDLNIKREVIDTLTLLQELVPFSSVISSETVANVPSESTVSVLVRLIDTTLVDGTVTIQNITVGDTFYDFKTGVITEEVSGTDGGDRGLVTPSAVIAGIIPDQVTGLVITQEMNNNATMDWDDAANATNYQVLRLNNFSTGIDVNANSTWYFREGGSLSGVQLDPICNFSVTTGTDGHFEIFGVDGNDRKPECYMMKTFPRDFLNNSRIQLNFVLTHTGSPADVFGDTFVNTQDDPNQIQRDDDSEWSANSPHFLRRTQGFQANAIDVVSLIDSQSLTKQLATFVRATVDLVDFQSDWNTPDTDYGSIIFQVRDENQASGQNIKLRVFWINITDFDTGLQKAFYNFSGGVKTNDPFNFNPLGCSSPDECERGTINSGSFNLTSENFEVIGTQTTSDFEDSTIPLQGVSTYKVRGNSTTGNFGLNSTEVEFGLIQQIQNLNATALNSTAIKLTWDLAVTEHPTDVLTGVIIQRLSPESIVYACSVCSSVGVEVGPLPNKVYGQRITLNQTETIDKIVNEQRWFNGAVTGGFIDVFIAHPNGTIIQSSVEVKSAVTIGIGGQDLAERTYTFSPGVTLVAGVYDFMTRWNGVGFTNAVTGKTAGDPNAGVRVLDQNNNFNDGYTPITIAGEDTTIFLNTTGFVTIVTVDDLDTMFTDTGLLENTEFTYIVKGQSAVSTGSFGVNASATTLTGVTVNAPTGFAGIANTTDITLSWNNQTDKESWTLSRNGTNIITGLTVLSFQDVGVPLDANLGYILTAINGTATNSTSEIVIKSNDIPSVVTGISGVPNNGIAIDLQWDDPVADDGEGSPTTGLNVLYDIFRQDFGLGDPFILVTTIAEGTGLFNDTTVIGGHTFKYKISARNEVGSAANSTETAEIMVDNALIIQVFESDGTTQLDGDVSIRLFNSTFTSTKIGDGQGRASFPMLSGIYNFTIFHIPTDFLINKTTSSVVVPPDDDVTVLVSTDVHRVNCPSNGPANDFLVLVNSTSPDHFIGGFTEPICDVDDKVSWNVDFIGFQGAALGGGGGGGSGTKITPIFNLIGQDGAIDPFADLGDSNGFIGQLFDLSGQMPIGTTFSVEKLVVRLLDVGENDGNFTGIILNNVTAGGLVSDHVVIATSQTIDSGTIVAPPGSPNSDSQVMEFTFTPAVAVTLDGTDFIGIQMADMTVSNLSTFFLDMSQVEGICLVANSTNWQSNCSIFGAGEDFAMEIGISDTSNLFNTTGGIASDKLVVHQTFDIAQLSDITGFVSTNTDLAKNKTLSNAGTFGSDADFTSYFERGLSSFPQAIVFNATGLLGESWIHNDVEDVFVVGSESNKDQFNFMHNADVEKTWSANFWLQQNAFNKFTDLTGTTIFLSTLGTFEADGMMIYTTVDKLGISIATNEIIPLSPSTALTAGIPADTDWHMVTVMVNFTNTTNSATMCLDNVCEVFANGVAPASTTSKAETTLIISDNDADSHNLILEVLQGYSMDELCIWKGHILSASDRATLFNSGNGALCGTVSASVGGGGGGGTSSFTTQMKSVVLSLGDFGNNAKNFEVNGTALPTTFGTPIIVSDPIVISTSTSNVKIFFDEFVLQSAPPPPGPPPITPTPPPPTKGPGGGGVPSLSVQDQQQFFEDLFGFSLFSKIHQMQIGQIQDGTIDITWNSPSQITIEGIEVGDQFVTWIGFPRTPFSLDGSDRISTGKIPYRIMPPNQLCDEVTGSSANCVDRILYEIPIKIHASVDGQPLTANTVVKVNLSLDITLALFTIFIAFAAGLGAIIYRSAIAHKQQKREKKKLTTKSKGRERMESRFGVKKAKIRRR